MRNPVCLLRALWRSILTGQPVSGHEFKTSADKTPDNVHVIECATCGKQSIGWSFESMEHLK